MTLSTFKSVAFFYVIKNIRRRSEQPLTHNDICISIDLDLTNHINHEQILKDLIDNEFVHYVEEI